MSSSRLLKLALPLVKTHGFTRETLSRSVLSLPANEVHTEPLSDTAVSALFGHGDDARRTLIKAWLGDGLRHMGSIPGVERSATPLLALEPSRTGTGKKASVRDVLRARLEYNEPALPYLSEAFALLISPSSGMHLLDPLPAVKHAARIAEKACYVTGDESLQLKWYSKRISLAAIYTAAELHQLTSPHTTYSFLDSLFDNSSSIKSSLDEVNLYSSYIFKSCRGIIKSSGIF
jgi:ubiquinone biosynthesis protein COQ9